MSDTPVTVASLMLFGLACTLSGREQLALGAFSKVRDLAKQMELFDVAHDLVDVGKIRRMTDDARRHTSHAAYGAYNWLR